MNVRRPDGDGSQHSQCYSGDAEQGAKWPLEGMGRIRAILNMSGIVI